jgi:hypothetical protein
MNDGGLQLAIDNLLVALRRPEFYDRLVDSPERFASLTRDDLNGLAELYQFHVQWLTQDVAAVARAAARQVAEAERRLARIEAALGTGEH